MINKTKNNICNLYQNLFDEQYTGKFNDFVYDFTDKVKIDFTLFNETKNKELENLLENIDYVIGNPPYVTLYGRRDRKKNEQFLDKLQVERERGITVKAQTASMFYEYDGVMYLLNLIDTLKGTPSASK